MKRYVIAGNGVAAAGCIEGIRSVDPRSPITVISQESRPVYCRPLISYYLEGKADLKNMPYRPAGFYESNGCTVLYGRRAAALDPAAQTVELDDGTKLPYTALCVAAGSSPLVPPFSGLETVRRRFSFLTLDDALALERALTPESRVLIVGAGLIGLKCAEGIRERVRSVTVCDLAPRILSSILDDDCAQLMRRGLEEHGISFLLEDTAAQFQGDTAVMRSGKTVSFDVLVLAVGVRANLSLVKDAGGQTDRGVVVDAHMATSLPGVYAAGDCAQGDDVSLGQKRVLAILPNAYLQGRCAGANMAGAGESFTKGIPMNSIGFFGSHAMTAGSYFGPEQGGQMYEERGDGTLKRLFTRDGRLTGFILIGPPQRAGIYTSLIREQVPLDTLDFERLKKAASFTAFPPQIRRQKFGGVV